MRVRSRLVGCSLPLLLVGVLANLAEAQFNGLIARVPSGANAVVILDVAKILASPLAQQQNWRQEQEKAAAAGLTMVPPTAQQFLMASHLDLEFSQPIWEVAMSNLSYEPSMPRIAAEWGGEIDRISNRNAVHLPDDSYIVEFGPRLAGLYRPGSRQSVSRWLAETDVSGNRLSPYLSSALEFVEKAGTPIIMALDLKDVISEDMVRARYKESEFLQASGIDEDQLVKAITSVQGVTLGVKITDKISGAIKVDFAEDVTFLGENAKPILLEVLRRHSAMVDEFESWTAKAEGTRIQIGGPLYRSGMQRILSLLSVPETLHRESPSSGPAGASPEDLAKFASQQYFKSVSGMLDDVRGSVSSAKSIGSVGTWLGRYADKIDKLPVLNVDPDLLNYGRYVAGSLRQASASVRGIGGKTRTRQLENPNSYNFVGRWGWNGGYGGYVQDVRAQQQDRTRIRTEERVSAADDARGIMQEVLEQTGDIRIKMSQKYQVEF